MSDIHAQDAARHVADNADEVSRLVIEYAHLVTAGTSCHYQILFAVEHSSVEHRSGLRLELLHMVLFIICNIDFRYDMTVLVNICLSTIEAIPFVGSDALHGSDIIELQRIVLSIAASEDSVAVVSHINGISAHVRPEDACDGTLFSDIIYLHGVVPAA